MSNAVALAIKITTDAQGAANGIDQVTNKTSKLGTAGKLAGRALAAGLGLAVVCGAKAVQAAAADEAAQVKLASALKNATGARASDIASVESWISAQGKALGVSDDELRPSLEALVTATGSVAKAQDLAAIAMDISARKGVSLESVSKSLAKAQATGNVAALAKYGVATKDAAGKQKSLEDVTKSLAATYKGAASASADTAAGKQKRLQVAMGELQEEIGAKLLPVLLKAAEYGLKVVDWITKNQTAAAAIVGTLAGLLAIIKLVSLATTIWSTATKVAAAAQAVFNAVMAANPIVLVVLAVAALVAVIVLVATKTQFFQQLWAKVWGAIGGPVMAAVNFIKNNWQKLLAILTGPIGIAVLLIAKHWDTIKAGGAAVVGWVRARFPAVKEIVLAPFKAAQTAIDKVWSGIKTGVDTVKTKVTNVLADFPNLASPFDAAKAALDKVISAVQSLIEWLKKIKVPDINLPGPLRTLAGTAGSGSNSGLLLAPRTVAPVIQIAVPGGFIGDDLALARKIRSLLADDLRRLSRTA